MKTTVENLDPSRIKLTVEVPYEELKPSLDAAYKEIGSQIQVPGFRRGHVPNRVIDQRVGRGAVIQEAVNNKLSDFYRDAITEAERVPMLQPEVDVVELPNATGENGGQLAFTAEVTVRPVIELPDLSKAKLTVDAVEVTDEDVDTELDNLRARFGSLKSVGRKAKTGDFVTIDLKAVIDGEEVDSISGVSYEIGKGNMLKGLDTALRGLKTDESATFTTELAGGEHAGEQAEVTVTATAVKQRELPKVDDEFAQLASEFDTVEELREDLVKQVTERKTGEQAVAARDALLEHLRSEVAFDVPEAVVEAEVAQHLRAEGKDGDEEHAKEIREDIVNGVRDQIILDVLAEDLKGPTAIAFVSGEPVEAAKTLRDFAKENPALVLKSGAMDGAPLSAEGVKKLADLESREVLLAKAAGVLKAKIGQAAFAFNALPVKAVRTIDALREKQSEAA